MIRNITTEALLEFLQEDNRVSVCQMIPTDGYTPDGIQVYSDDLETIVDLIPNYDSTITVGNPDDFAEDGYVLVIDMPIWLLTFEAEAAGSNFRMYCEFNTESGDQAREEGHERARGLGLTLIEVRELCFGSKFNSSAQEEPFWKRSET